ncbi:MAG: hypothetical protein WAV78_23010 [Xanthobacteraceae bacterium]
MTPVLEQERACDGSIARIHVDSRPVLCGGQENFRQVAILEPADARGVVYSAVLEAKQFVASPVWQAAARFERPGHSKSSKLTPGGPIASARPFDLIKAGAVGGIVAPTLGRGWNLRISPLTRANIEDVLRRFIGTV